MLLLSTDQKSNMQPTNDKPSPASKLSICSRCFSPRPTATTTTATITTTTTMKALLITTTCLVACLAVQIDLGRPQIVVVEAASANRVNMHQVSRQTNQYFLNEFCDLESKTLRSAKKLKQASDTHSLFLTSRNSLSSVRVLPQKQQIPSSISFGFGSSQQQQLQQQHQHQKQQQQQQQQQAQQQLQQASGGVVAARPSQSLYKQLNCSIIVVAPKLHGLLVTVNSIGLPKNLTKLGITLNHDSPHAQHIHLEGETTSANYLLTQPSSSKIAINLQSFQPIDWSHVSFDILFTVYKRSNGTGGCPNKKWFDCGDNICVPASLVCDRNRNCPNGNDEMIFYRCYSPLFWSIAASTALAIVLIVLVISVVVWARRRRLGRLSKLNSFSNNQLAVDNDLMHETNSSKLDLTQESAAKSNSYLASNLYLGGFENPVWTNGTLTKSAKYQFQIPRQQQQLLQAGGAADDANSAMNPNQHTFDNSSPSAPPPQQTTTTSTSLTPPDTSTAAAAATTTTATIHHQSRQLYN